MGAAAYIVLEKQLPGLLNMPDGKALSRADHVLTPLARQIGVKPLMDFFSMAREDYVANAEQFNIPLDPEGPPEEQWFPAAEGLLTVRSLIRHVEAHPEALEAPGRVLDDLRDFADVLEEAEKNGVRWHLGVDY